MPQIHFTVTEKAAAYLRWYARNVLFEKSANAAARHMMLHRLEGLRHENRKSEPGHDDLIYDKTESDDENED